MGDLKGRSWATTALMLGLPAVLLVIDFVDRSWVGMGAAAALLAITLTTPGTTQRRYANITFYGLLLAGWVAGFLSMIGRGRGAMIGYIAVAAVGGVLFALAWPRIRRAERERAAELAAAETAETP